MTRTTVWLAFLFSLSSCAVLTSQGTFLWPVQFADLAYPADALEQRLVGLAIVRVTANDAGRVVNVEPLAGPDVLARASIANARTWVLHPDQQGLVVYRFEIDAGQCQDDSRSLSRLIYPDHVLVTACSRPGRPPARWSRPAVEFASRGRAPSYPDVAANARLGGVVVLELRIDADGTVNANPLSGNPLLSQTAVAHARQWRARPTSARITFEVYEFRLDNRDCEKESNTTFWMSVPGHVVLSGCARGFNASAER